MADLASILVDGSAAWDDFWMLAVSAKLKLGEITSGNGSYRGGSSLDSSKWIHHDGDAEVVCWMDFLEIDGGWKMEKR